MNCTLGGMIGNNSCGATAQRTGKVVDSIAAPEMLAAWFLFRPLNLVDGTGAPGRALAVLP
jgi:FAD/FMN-containing dehydrogenase